jgi:hypothetical protein
MSPDARSPDDVRFMFQQIGMELDFNVILEHARDRLARRLHTAELRSASEAEPRPTLEEEMAFAKEALANTQKRNFLRRRKVVLDFEQKCDNAQRSVGDATAEIPASIAASDTLAGRESVNAVDSAAIAEPIADDASEADVSPGKRE